MSRYLTPRDIQDRYGVSAPTARAYMRRMTHQEKPLRVRPEDADAWDLSRTYGAGETPSKADARPARRRKAQQPPPGKFQIPRKRPA